MLKFLDRFDPLKQFVEYTLSGFTKPENTSDKDRDFVASNVQKHRRVLWINLAACVCIVLGLRDTPKDIVLGISLILSAPVVVLGAGWFVITFVNIRDELLAQAQVLTQYMFGGFLVCLSMMFISPMFVLSPWFVPPLAYVYYCIVSGCIRYDTADGLQIGLSSAQLKAANLLIEIVPLIRAVLDHKANTD